MSKLTKRDVAAFDGDDVDLSHVGLSLLRENVKELARDEERDTELLRGSLEPGSHVDVRRQIGGVDLVEGTNGTFDGPANVEAKSHLDGVVRHSIVQLFVFFVLLQLSRAPEGCNDLEEGQCRHVCHLVDTER